MELPVRKENVTAHVLFTFLFGFLSSAIAGRKILVYPTTETGAVSYTESPGTGYCRMTIHESEGAQVIEENDHDMKIRFDRPSLQGCTQLFGRNMQEGWVSKDEFSYGENDATPVEIPPEAPPECESNLMKKPKVLDDLAAKTEKIGAGLKSFAEIDKYMKCFADSSEGFGNYKKFSPMMDKITQTFTFKKNGADYNIDPVLFRCLIRRESAFNPLDRSKTGAVGLGQHTDINIRHINNRLQQKSSWERQLWDRFFSRMKNNASAQQMMAQCPRTAGGQPPKFESKADAACPLNSLAASAIYNLEIQESLRRSSKIQAVEPSQQLNYQIAIGATYNLGSGAAAKAVNDLVVDGWVDSIHRQSPTLGKSAEVGNHIVALRNCMQGRNWKPMVAGDHSRCENAPGENNLKKTSTAGGR